MKVKTEKIFWRGGIATPHPTSAPRSSRRAFGARPRRLVAPQTKCLDLPLSKSAKR